MRAKEIVDSVMSFESSSEAKKYAKRYFVSMNAIKVLAVAVFVTIAVTTVANHFSTPWVLVGIFAIIYVVYYGKKALLRNSLFKMMQVDCDPEKYCDYYYALMGYAQKRTPPLEAIWNFAMALNRQGRFDESLKVFDAMRQYIRHPREGARYNAFLIFYSYSTRNGELLIESCEVLRTQLQDSSIKKREKEKLAVYLKYEYLFDLEQRFDLVEQQMYIERVDAYPGMHMCIKVLNRYFFSEAARVVGNKEIEEAWLRYVDRYGGTMWCAKKARERLEVLDPSSNENADCVSTMCQPQT